MSGAGEVRRHLLREPRFRSFFVAPTISQFGDRISELAFPLPAVLVLDATAAQVSVLTGDGLRSRAAG
ncbi:hypothetical protein GCM10023176_43820 [Micromonospora coerulea]|uniref:Uncharacterized protein n=1 Tax=Micromonospora coerulea TaxID=47856 RepID=A0ABP8SW12_9ACTN